jgi:hypothetical protein
MKCEIHRKINSGLKPRPEGRDSGSLFKMEGDRFYVIVVNPYPKQDPHFQKHVIEKSCF